MYSNNFFFDKKFLNSFNWINNLSIPKNKKLKKTKLSVLKEFDKDKYKFLFNKTKNNFFDHELLYRILCNKSKINIYRDKKFQLMNPNTFHRYHINYIYKKILQHTKFQNFIELGAGFGNSIFTIQKINKKKDINFVAAEPSRYGRLLINKISENTNIKISVKNCDILSNNIINNFKFTNSVIFTNFVYHYITNISDSLINNLIKTKADYFVNVEPVYDENSSLSLHSFFMRNYIDLNDYNKNFLCTLKNFENKKKIKIIYYEKMNFSANPFLVPSIIIWKKI